MTSEADERREQVLAALVRARGDGVSGQALAERLGCSRAAVHRHVEALRRGGVAVDGVHEGYRLAVGCDPVSATVVTEGLVPPLRGPVRWSAETGSTNDDLVAMARGGAAEGLVVGADLQRAGRGRRGRAWVTHPGDALLFSVLLRPRVSAGEAAVLPVVVAAAVARALGPAAGIVWPNDLVVDGAKVCGVLCETAVDEAGTDWVVVGIGVNVRRAPEVTDGRWRAGCLADSGDTRSRGTLLSAILTELSVAYREWRDTGPEPALAEFATRDLLRGEAVRVHSFDREMTGTANGLDDRGRLRVRTAGGEVAVDSGEVTKAD